MKPTTIVVSSVIGVFLATLGYQFIPGVDRPQTALRTDTATVAPAAGPLRAAAVDVTASSTARTPAVPATARPLETRPAAPEPRLAQNSAPAAAPSAAPPAAAQPNAAPATPTRPAPAQPAAASPAAGPVVAQLSGSFRGADAGHQSSGRVDIVKTDKGFDIRLVNFSVTRGPDLELWLVDHADPKTKTDVTKAKYVSLGRLKSFTGDQTYAVPAGVDPAAFKSVVVWCEDFSVLFASAALKGKS